MSTKTNDSNTAHDGAGDHDDLVSHLTPYRRAQMSPSAAMNSSQAQQEPGDDDLMESGTGVFRECEERMMKRVLVDWRLIGKLGMEYEFSTRELIDGCRKLLDTEK